MPETERSRTVRLVLCSPAGDVLGALGPFPVEEPWWPAVGPVVAGARERFGIRIVVLRLLATETSGAVMGGAVTYLAELGGSPPEDLALQPADADAAGPDDPLRMPWARPGGVQAAVARADGALRRLGRPRTGPAEQIKSWNLSSLVRLPTGEGAAWSKSVPPFMAHEGAIVALVAATDPGLVPRLLAADPAAGTVLLDDVPGEDLFEADLPLLLEMVERLVRLQAGLAGGTDRLLAAGLPDWRAPAFARAGARLLARADVRSELETDVLERLDGLILELPARFEDLAACGLPETLVHGDFHPGNWRSGADRPVLVDWGDSGVGHPLFDMPAFLTRIAPGHVDPVRAEWLEAWRAERPDADPARAAELLAPVAALRQALIYRMFLDNIEASERVYHRDDPATWLREAVVGG